MLLFRGMAGCARRKGENIGRVRAPVCCATSRAGGKARPSDETSFPTDET